MAAGGLPLLRLVMVTRGGGRRRVGVASQRRRVLRPIVAVVRVVVTAAVLAATAVMMVVVLTMVVARAAAIVMTTKIVLFALRSFVRLLYVLAQSLIAKAACNVRRSQFAPVARLRTAAAASLHRHPMLVVSGRQLAAALVVEAASHAAASSRRTIVDVRAAAAARTALVALPSSRWQAARSRLAVAYGSIVRLFLVVERAAIVVVVGFVSYFFDLIDGQSESQRIVETVARARNLGSVMSLKKASLWTNEGSCCWLAVPSVARSGRADRCRGVSVVCDAY